MLLLCILIALFTWAHQPQRRIALDLTTRSNEKFLDGFYLSEGGTRWTESHSTVWLRGLGGANLGWHLGLRLSGPRPSDLDAAAHVIVKLNGANLAEFDADNQDKDYEWEIRPSQLRLNGDLLLEIDSSTFKSPLNEGQLGVRIARVWLTRNEGIAFPPLGTLLLILALVSSCAVLLQMLLAVSLRHLSFRTRTQFLDPLCNPWAWVLVAMWLIAVIALRLNQLQAAWWLQTLTLGLLLMTMLICLLARLVPATVSRRQAWRILILFTLAALIRIPLDFGRGYETDVEAYLALAWKTAHYGIQSAYHQINGSPPSDNPPLLLYPFWLLGTLYRTLFSPQFGHTRLIDSDLLRFMLRLPGFAADLLTGALIFRVLYKRGAVPFTAVLFATAAYLLNPAIILDSAYWGQTASIHTLLMLLSVIAIDCKACGWAGAALAAAILTKPQALAIAPIIFLMTLRERGLVRFTFAAVVATLLIIAPFTVAGRLGDVAQQYRQTTQYDPYISINAHNLWWFITGGKNWLPDTDSLGIITFRTIGVSLFMSATLLSLAVVWHDRQTLFRAAAYQSLAFFMLNTQIHENHLLPMFAPLAIAAALDRRSWRLYGAFALTAAANMTLHDPSLLGWLGYSVEEMISGTPALSTARWLNAALQTLLFAIFTLQLVKPLRHAMSARLRCVHN